MAVAAIVGVAGSIHPIAAPLAEVAVTLASGVVALLLLLPNRNGLIVRGRGVMLLILWSPKALIMLISEAMSETEPLAALSKS